MMKKEYLGIDIGASGVKGAIVDVETGKLLGERLRLATPIPSTPDAVAQTFTELVEAFNWKGKIIGCGFPSIIKNGIALTAANIHKTWIGTNVGRLFSDASGCMVTVRNDADVAGIAEMNFGSGKGKKGTVLLITVGSGLGSALFTHGKLLPNTEFGHLYLKGQNKIAEQYASDGARKRKELSWDDWGKRFNDYLNHIDALVSPNLIILGGGASKKFAKFENNITIDTPVIPAQLLNNAGIIGAAIHAFNIESKLELI